MVAQLRACAIQHGILVLAEPDNDMNLSDIIHVLNVLLVHAAQLVMKLPVHSMR